ncbi:MAG TPA: hypothetical protein VGY56_08950 [Verrucomicrobiae bacterium]|nr:hypothetical protein [Verrucomicrobiae bacterium]
MEKGKNIVAADSCRRRLAKVGEEGPFHFFCVYVSKRVNGEENGVKMMVKGSVLLGIVRILRLGTGV